MKELIGHSGCSQTQDNVSGARNRSDPAGTSVYSRAFLQYARSISMVYISFSNRIQKQFNAEQRENEQYETKMREVRKVEEFCKGKEEHVEMVISLSRIK
jgi:hypothetical protein